VSGLPTRSRSETTRRRNDHFGPFESGRAAWGLSGRSTPRSATYARAVVLATHSGADAGKVRKRVRFGCLSPITPVQVCRTRLKTEASSLGLHSIPAGQTVGNIETCPGLQYPNRRWTFAVPSRVGCVPVRKPRIISGDDSEIHDEPHIRRSRITVQHIHARVEERGLRPDSDYCKSFQYRSHEGVQSHRETGTVITMRRWQTSSMCTSQTRTRPSPTTTAIPRRAGRRSPPAADYRRGRAPRKPRATIRT